MFADSHRDTSTPTITRPLSVMPLRRFAFEEAALLLDQEVVAMAQACPATQLLKEEPASFMEIWREIVKLDCGLQAEYPQRHPAAVWIETDARSARVLLECFGKTGSGWVSTVLDQLRSKVTENTAIEYWGIPFTITLEAESNPDNCDVFQFLSRDEDAVLSETLGTCALYDAANGLAYCLGSFHSASDNSFQPHGDILSESSLFFRAFKEGEQLVSDGLEEPHAVMIFTPETTADSACVHLLPELYEQSMLVTTNLNLTSLIDILQWERGDGRPESPQFRDRAVAILRRQGRGCKLFLPHRETDAEVEASLPFPLNENKVNLTVQAFDLEDRRCDGIGREPFSSLLELDCSCQDCVEELIEPLLFSTDCTEASMLQSAIDLSATPRRDLSLLQFKELESYGKAWIRVSTRAQHDLFARFGFSDPDEPTHLSEGFEGNLGETVLRSIDLSHMFQGIFGAKSDSVRMDICPPDLLPLSSSMPLRRTERELKDRMRINSTRMMVPSVPIPSSKVGREQRSFTLHVEEAVAKLTGCLSNFQHRYTFSSLSTANSINEDSVDCIAQCVPSFQHFLQQSTASRRLFPKIFEQYKPWIDQTSFYHEADESFMVARVNAEIQFNLGPASIATSPPKRVRFDLPSTSQSRSGSDGSPSPTLSGGLAIPQPLQSSRLYASQHSIHATEIQGHLNKDKGSAREPALLEESSLSLIEMRLQPAESHVAPLQQPSSEQIPKPVPSSFVPVTSNRRDALEAYMRVMAPGKAAEASKSIEIDECVEYVDVDVGGSLKDCLDLICSMSVESVHALVTKQILPQSTLTVSTVSPNTAEVLVKQHAVRLRQMLLQAQPSSEAIDKGMRVLHETFRVFLFSLVYDTCAEDGIMAGLACVCSLFRRVDYAPLLSDNSSAHRSLRFLRGLLQKYADEVRLGLDGAIDHPKQAVCVLEIERRSNNRRSLVIVAKDEVALVPLAFYLRKKVDHPVLFGSDMMSGQPLEASSVLLVSEKVLENREFDWSAVGHIIMYHRSCIESDLSHFLSESIMKRTIGISCLVRSGFNSAPQSSNWHRQKGHPAQKWIRGLPLLCNAEFVSSFAHTNKVLSEAGLELIPRKMSFEHIVIDDQSFVSSQSL